MENHAKHFMPLLKLGRKISTRKEIRSAWVAHLLSIRLWFGLGSGLKFMRLSAVLGSALRNGV